MIYWRWFLSFLLGFGLSVGTHSVVRAESPETAPAELKALITQIDTTANRQDNEKIQSFYSSQFVTADGLTADAMFKSLKQLWKSYPNLKYKTELQSWEKDGNNWIAQTLTTIEGSSSEQRQPVQLKATIKSRQTIQDGKLIRQEILTERTQLSSGTNAPQVKVNLPETVKVGQEFDFDVIIQEPLGDDLLAGTAIAQNVESSRFLEPTAIELDLLQSGGLFKRVKADNKPQDRWFSALLVRGTGMILITQRVRIQP